MGWIYGSEALDCRDIDSSSHRSMNAAVKAKLRARLGRCSGGADLQELRGRTAVITGGGGGIGRSLAFTFAKEGMNIVVSDVDLDAATVVVDEVKALGVRSLAVKTDVSNKESVDELADVAYREMGSVHVLCNNAGVVTMKLAQDMSEDDWDWVIGVNLWGTIHGVEAFVPRMAAAGEGGHVVNTASIAGLVPEAIPGIISYTTSKHGVVGLSESLRFDLAGKGIGVTVLCPGGVRTRIGEAGRNRPERFGGPEAPMLPAAAAPPPAQAPPVPTTMDPDDLAAMVLAAVRNDEMYVLSHADTRESVETRFGGLLDAFDAFAAREGSG